MLNRNSIPTGVIATLLSEVLCALILFLVMLIPAIGMAGHERWFAAAFVPPLLLVRHYAKAEGCPLALKASITTLFLTFVAFMWIMIKYRFIVI